MKTITFALTTVIAFALLTPSLALADWDEGDGHKMHSPQLPDPDGWDVNLHGFTVADDWKCSQSGPVKDIHFWYSDRYDLGLYHKSLSVAIYSNVEAFVDQPYSHPGDLLWSRSFDSSSRSWRKTGSGAQGWYEPNPFDPVYVWLDHEELYQLNLEDIPDPFIQQQDTIYWLAISAELPDIPEVDHIGWKTSLNHFEDVAVWRHPADPQWRKLNLQNQGIDRVDLAFVINVPEPATLALLALGGVALLRRR